MCAHSQHSLSKNVCMYIYINIVHKTVCVVSFVLVVVLYVVVFSCDDDNDTTTTTTTISMTTPLIVCRWCSYIRNVYARERDGKWPNIRTRDIDYYVYYDENHIRRILLNRPAKMNIKGNEKNAHRIRYCPHPHYFIFIIVVVVARQMFNIALVCCCRCCVFFCILLVLEYALEWTEK